MTARTASCRCGQLSATTQGEPTRLSVCHCLNCKKRSGSAFAVQARWPVEQVAVEGERKVFTRAGDSGDKAHFHFCPTCGSDLFYVADAMPDLIAIPLGAFDDPFFGHPEYSVFEERRHPWVAILGDEVEHYD